MRKKWKRGSCKKSVGEEKLNLVGAPGINDVA